MKKARNISILAMLLVLSCSSMMFGCGEDWEAKIQDYVENSLVVALNSAPANEVRKVFCRKADVAKKLFSVRSFEGRMCDAKIIKGLDLVGGAALFMCWDENTEEFKNSGCAEKALAQWKMSKGDYNKQKLFEAMKPVVLDYVKKTEEAVGGAVPYYTQAKFIFCLFDASLYGPGKELHELLCKK